MRTDGKTHRHDETNNSFMQFWKRALKLCTLLTERILVFRVIYVINSHYHHVLFSLYFKRIVFSFSNTLNFYMSFKYTPKWQSDLKCLESVFGHFLGRWTENTIWRKCSCNPIFLCGKISAFTFFTLPLKVIYWNTSFFAEIILLSSLRRKPESHNIRQKHADQNFASW